MSEATYCKKSQKSNANSFYFAANAVAGFTGNSITTGDEVGKLQNVYISPRGIAIKYYFASADALISKFESDAALVSSVMGAGNGNGELTLASYVAFNG